MDIKVDCVLQSYQRCVENFGFLNEFYSRFIDASPEVASKFANTDMDHQVLMLRASLDLMLGAGNFDSDRMDLDQVAHLHSQASVDVPPQLYDHWIESLLATVKMYDPSFDAALEQAWRDALVKGVARMKAAY
ncbi:MAG: globin [Halopseudomonas sp.]